MNTPGAGTEEQTDELWPTREMLDAGEYILSEWLNDDAPVGQSRYRQPAAAAFKAMVAAGSAEIRAANAEMELLKILTMKLMEIKNVVADENDWGDTTAVATNRIHIHGICNIGLMRAVKFLNVVRDKPREECIDE